jgi:GAF domain-containing protein
MIPALLELTDALLAETQASRSTIRLDTAVARAALLAESLAPGVRPMVPSSVADILAAPTYQFLLRERRLLIQRDCRIESPAPPRSLIDQDRVWAQMLAPVLERECLLGVISVHVQGSVRDWSPADLSALCMTQDLVSRWCREHRDELGVITPTEGQG